MSEPGGSVTLSTEAAEVTIAPDLGAGVLRFALADGRDIFRPSPGPEDGLGCACYLLAPWCNRIDGGITLPGGAFHAIAPTHPAHPLPIHGSAALSRWAVVAQDAAEVTLAAEIDWPAPFHYLAEVTYRLVGAALGVHLRVQHLGADPLPYGLGLHPWFVRAAGSRLQACATHWQQTDARQLPVGDVAVSDRPEWDFNALRALPEGLIDTGFGGWDGRARLEIDAELAVEIATDPALGHHQVYSTGAEADFICFEPVTHPINAHNAPNYPGLQTLTRDEATEFRVTFNVTVAR